MFAYVLSLFRRCFDCCLSLKDGKQEQHLNNLTFICKIT